MYNRNNSNRELYTRSGDVNSERWSQQFLSDSQDWGTQLFSSQDAQRPSGGVPPSNRPSTFMQQNLSQGSSRGGGAGTSGRSTSQPVGLGGDVSLARDIRFGLHTILSVMRELPNQLKDISSEVVRTSQQPEETNDLIKETSEKLQGLVLGLETKLTQLLENKENSDILQQSITKHEGKLNTLISKVEDLANQSRQDEQVMLEEHKNATKKEVRKEVKKIHEAIDEWKSSDLVGRSLNAMQEDITKMCERLGSHEENMQSLDKERQSAAVQVLVITKESFKEVHSTLDNIIEKMSVLPQEIHSQVNKAVSDAFHNCHIPSYGTNSRLVSPVERMLSLHRPMIPFSESFHRSQVSPVAQVHPQIIARPIATTNMKSSVWDETQKQEIARRIENERNLSTPVSATQRPFARCGPRAIPNISRPVTQNAARVNAQSDALLQQDKNVPGKLCENPGNFLHIKLLEAETQQFTPEIMDTKSLNDSEDIVILQCDSGGSSNSSEEYSFEVAKVNKDTVFDNCESIVRSFKAASTDKLTGYQSKTVLGTEVPKMAPPLPRPITTPNVRKTPSMAVQTKAVITNQDFPSKPTFSLPSNPIPCKKPKPGERLDKGLQKRQSVVQPYRRYLTPVSRQGLRFKFASRKKKT